MKFKYEVKKIKDNEAEFKFTITPVQLNEAKDKAYEEQFKPEYTAKGFRKGQAPRSTFERDKGFERVQYEAINLLIETAYKQAFDKDEGFKILGFPKLDFDQKLLNEVIVSPFELTLTFPILPPVTLGKYKGLNVEAKEVKVTDKEVKEAIDEELSKKVKQVAKKEGSTVEKGDIAVIDFEGFKDNVAFEGGKAENHHLKIGSGSFIPGFEDQLIGLKKGDKKDVKLSFPKEYHEKSLAGAPVVFKVTVNDIQVEENPKLTDDFVKELKIDKVQTVAEYKKHVENHILEHKKHHEEHRQLDEILKLVVKDTKADIHDGTFEYDVERRLEDMSRQVSQYGLTMEQFLQATGKTEEEYRKDLRKQAETNIRQMVVSDAIMEKEKIEATKEEVQNRYTEIAKLYNIPPATVKKQVQEGQIQYEIKMKKLNEFLIKNNVVSKKKKTTTKK